MFLLWGYRVGVCSNRGLFYGRRSIYDNQRSNEGLGNYDHGNGGFYGGQVLDIQVMGWQLDYAEFCRTWPVLYLFVCLAGSAN